MKKENNVIWLLILFYLSVIINYRYYTVLISYSEVRLGLAYYTGDFWRLSTLVLIYTPMLFCILGGILLVRYLMQRYSIGTSFFARIFFPIWAIGTIIFPVFANKVYFNFAVLSTYGICYLIISGIIIFFGLLDKKQTTNVCV